MKPKQAQESVPKKPKQLSSHILEVMRWAARALVLIVPLHSLLETGHKLLAEKPDTLAGGLSQMALQFLVATLASIILCLPPILFNLAAWLAERQHIRLAIVSLGAIILCLVTSVCGGVTVSAWALLSDDLGDYALPGSEWLEKFGWAIMWLSTSGVVWAMPSLDTRTQLGQRIRQAWQAQKRQHAGPDAPESTSTDGPTEESIKESGTSG
jgi:hypothetical protein